MGLKQAAAGAEERGEAGLAGQGMDCHSPPVHGWMEERREQPPVGGTEKGQG